MLPDSITGPAHRIGAALRERGESVAVAESSAGGLISAGLLSVPGASAYYRGGFVVYTLDGIRTMLAGASDLEPGNRGVTEQLGRYLAASAAARLGADWGVGETGATGPAANPYGDAGGNAWVGVAGPGHLDAERVLTDSDDREANMVAFATRALEKLAAALSG